MIDVGSWYETRGQWPPVAGHHISDFETVNWPDEQLETLLGEA